MLEQLLSTDKLKVWMTKINAAITACDGKADLAGATFTGNVEAGSGSSSDSIEFVSIRLCANDSNTVNKAVVAVSEDGKTIVKHIRGTGTSVDSYLAFDAENLVFGTSGTKGNTETTEYKVWHSGNLEPGDILPDQTDKENCILATDGVNTYWSDALNSSLFLFSHMYSDHIVNDASYLRADTFSWHSGIIYVSAYEKLLEEWNSVSTTSTDTYGDISITYKRTVNNFKICSADQQEALRNLFNETGTAWYYVIDTAENQFKLPRSKNILRGSESMSTVGNSSATLSTGTDVITDTTTSYGSNVYTTEQYLYFFIGRTLQYDTEVKMNIGEYTELLNSMNARYDALIARIEELEDGSNNNNGEYYDALIARIEKLEAEKLNYDFTTGTM